MDGRPSTCIQLLVSAAIKMLSPRWQSLVLMWTFLPMMVVLLLFLCLHLWRIEQARHWLDLWEAIDWWLVWMPAPSQIDQKNTDVPEATASHWRNTTHQYQLQIVKLLSCCVLPAAGSTTLTYRIIYFKAGVVSIQATTCSRNTTLYIQLNVEAV
jgi:hypothetical protein